MNWKRFAQIPALAAVLALGALTPAIAQDTDYGYVDDYGYDYTLGDGVDQQQWWNPADWFDDRSMYNTGSGTYDYYSDDYYEDHYDYSDVGYDSEGGIDWFGGDSWDYQDSAWDYDNDYWSNDWNYDGWDSDWGYDNGWDDSW